ncbi:MAG: class I SAM-dependent methyltransferase [Candidatus Doudnabacteria bacterium]|nr:class I SAM-dependent methyltransferase [Candidatus Doudnabacteria bacterium]
MPEVALNFSWIKKLFVDGKKPQFSIFDLPDSSKILDVSCGEGNLLKCLQNNNPSLRLYGLDISKKVIETAKARFPKINFCEGQAEALPFSEKSFKAVVTSMALHHYKNPKEVFKEIARVLEPEGLCYLVDYVPKNKWSQRLNNLFGCHEPYHFEKYYTSQEIEDIASSEGLKFIAKNEINFFYAQTRMVFIKINYFRNL